MPSPQDNFLDQIRMIEEIIPQIDQSYSRLTRYFKTMIPLLKKRLLNSEDQSILKDYLHGVHEELHEFGRLLRHGEGEKDLIRGEILRLRASQPKTQGEYAIAEAELWAIEQNLQIREKCLNHLNELIQLLDSIMKTGEMTELDERLLTEIVFDLKNLGA